MKWIKEQWDLLGVYSMKFHVCIHAALCVYFVVRSFYSKENYEMGFMLITALFFVSIIVMDFIVTNYSHLCDKYKGQLADAQDDLIVKEHEVERLTLELETAQAALVEAKKPKKNHSGYVQTGFSQIESGLAPKTASIDTAEANALKPKRKPASRGTRKPKTKNENKD